MAEKSTSLATAIVGLFNGFYKVYLETDNDSPENGCESLSGEKLNIDEDKETICIYYNSIAEQLDGIGIDEKRKIEFQTELDALPSKNLETFLANLVNFKEAYKLDGLTDVLEYVEVIKCKLNFNQAISATKNKETYEWDDIVSNITKDEAEGKFTNAEKYLAGLIIAVGKEEKIDEALNDPLENLKTAYTQGIFFKDEQGMKLIVKTVKELGITEEYGKSMKKIDIGLYYKKMSFNNPVLICKEFSNWEELKKRSKEELDALQLMNGMDKNDFEQLKAIYYMERPHAHHALYKNWHEMVEEAQDILWEYDIDPFVGLENLCWAPNIKGQHSTKHVNDIIGGLKKIKDRRWTYEKTRKAIIRKLNRYKESASSFGQ